MSEEGVEQRRESRTFPAAFVVGLVVVLILAGGLVWLTRVMQSPVPAQGGKLPFGPDEQSYAQQIHFQPGQMSQAENFLNQEFIYVAGTVTNSGSRAVRALDVVLEFRDPFNQLVLRDPQRVITADDQPLKPAESRNFQVTLGSHLPVEWNRQYPAFRITGLVLK